MKRRLKGREDTFLKEVRLVKGRRRKLRMGEKTTYERWDERKGNEKRTH